MPPHDHPCNFLGDFYFLSFIPQECCKINMCTLFSWTKKIPRFLQENITFMGSSVITILDWHVQTWLSIISYAICHLYAWASIFLRTNQVLMLKSINLNTSTNSLTSRHETQLPWHMLHVKTRTQINNKSSNPLNTRAHIILTSMYSTFFIFYFFKGAG